MTHFRVPVLDIGAWTGDGCPQDRARVAADLDAACCTVGFVQVLGHGIGDDVQAGLARALDDFFTLPTEAKAARRRDARGQRGWTPPGDGHRGSEDHVETFTVGTSADEHPWLDLPQREYAANVWPPELPGFRPAVQAYTAEAARVARTLTRIFACALDVPADVFTAATDHSLDVLRLHHYRSAPEGEPTGMAPHTDGGILTVLWTDGVPGLQVLGIDRQWHDVVPVPGALVVNLGDLAARWTNDEWRSTVHRVLPPVAGGTVRRRLSAAFLHQGNTDAVVAAIPSCVPRGQRPVHPPHHDRRAPGGEGPQRGVPTGRAR